MAVFRFITKRNVSVDIRILHRLKFIGNCYVRVGFITSVEADGQTGSAAQAWRAPSVPGVRRAR